MEVEVEVQVVEAEAEVQVVEAEAEAEAGKRRWGRGSVKPVGVRGGSSPSLHVDVGGLAAQHARDQLHPRGDRPGG